MSLDVSFGVSYNSSIVYHAIEENQANRLCDMIGRINIDQEDDDGFNYLDYAIVRAHPKCVDILLMSAYLQSKMKEVTIQIQIIGDKKYHCVHRDFKMSTHFLSIMLFIRGDGFLTAAYKCRPINLIQAQDSPFWLQCGFDPRWWTWELRSLIDDSIDKSNLYALLEVMKLIAPYTKRSPKVIFMHGASVNDLQKFPQIRPFLQVMDTLTHFPQSLFKLTTLCIQSRKPEAMSLSDFVKGIPLPAIILNKIWFFYEKLTAC